MADKKNLKLCLSFALSVICVLASLVSVKRTDSVAAESAVNHVVRKETVTIVDGTTDLSVPLDESMNKDTEAKGLYDVIFHQPFASWHICRPLLNLESTTEIALPHCPHHKDEEQYEIPMTQKFHTNDTPEIPLITEF